MTQQDIIKLAREIGLPTEIYAHPGVKQLVRDAVAAEREACAKVCEEHGKVWAERFLLGFQATLDDAADAIRARGNQC